MKIAEYNKTFKLKNTKSKFGNIRTNYNGTTFDSKKEAMYSRDLDLRKSATNPRERVVSYETQVKYKFVHNDLLICVYKLDFLVTYADGHIEYIDVKSVATRKDKVFRIKKKMMKAFFDIDVTEAIY